MFAKMLASMGGLLVCAIPVFAQEVDWRVYYPLQVKHRWTYISSDPKAAPDPKKKDADPKKDIDPNKQFVIEVERAEDITRKVKKENKDVEEKFAGFILKITSGDKVKRDHVVIMSDGVQRFSVEGTAINPPLVFLKFNLKIAGETWSWDSTTGNTAIKGTCTIGVGKVQVPYRNRATLDAITVAFSNNKPGAERHEIMTWYVLNVGMVKQHVKAGNHEIVHELVDFTPTK